MQIYFNGVLIAQEPQQGGTDIISGFLPKGAQRLQSEPILRADWIYLKARGNRVHTLTGTIVSKAFDTLDAAVLDLMLRFTNLPQEGMLVFTEGSTTVVFQKAVLESFEPGWRTGVRYSVDMTFQATTPAQAGNQNLQTESGGNIETESGTDITT